MSDDADPDEVRELALVKQLVAYFPDNSTLPTVILPAASVVEVSGSHVVQILEAAAVVDSSFFAQDEKDNVKIIKISNGIFIFILFL